MGKELEWKLEVSDPEQLDAIMKWDGLQEYLAEAPRVCQMQTTYFDTANRLLSARNITLRRRMENGCPVVCLKVPLPGKDPSIVRREWELNCDELSTALTRFLALGAPAVLPDPSALIPVCGAEFLRQAVMLRFPDNSRSELALDYGSLLGSTRRMPLCELELELKAGKPEASLRLLRSLMSHFGLRVQPLSKYARALALG